MSFLNRRKKTRRVAPGKVVQADSNGLRGRRARHTPVFLAVLFFCLLFTLTVNIGMAHFPLKAGRIALFDVPARVNFTAEDPVQTEKLRKEAAERAARVYRFSREKVDSALAQASELLAAPVPAQVPENLRESLSGLSEKQFAELAKALARAGEDKIRSFLAGVENLVAERYVYMQDEALQGEAGRVFIIEDREWYPMQFDPKDPRDSKVLRDASQLVRDITVLASQSLFGRGADKALSEWTGKALSGLLAGHIEPDPKATQRGRDAARSHVRPVMRSYQRGDILIYRGSSITKADIAVVNEEMLRFTQSMPVREFNNLLGGMLLVAVATLVFSLYLLHQQPQIIKVSTVLVLGGFLWVVLVVARLAALGVLWPLLVPLLLVVTVVTIVYGERLGLAYALYGGFLVQIALNQNVMLAAALSTGALVAPFVVGKINRRWTVLAAGILAAAAQVAVILGVGLIQRTPVGEIGWNSLGGAANGLVTGFLVTGLLPGIEWAFGVTTNISLLELSDLNHPLLKTLAMRAPGTYHHSLVVGHLAESAAKAIGANPLLARVGAYFHDVGKINKPLYFVENQAGAPSKHENLAPTMSTLVIVAHAKDGLELADEYGLPQPVKEIIVEHHGTTLVEYFYHQARERSEEGEEPKEEAFRYPGPKPLAKESAIVLLADSVESSSRTLVEPNPSRIESLVHAIVQAKMEDGQLDRSNLTLNEIHRVENSFAKMLASIYHARVRYPSQQENGEMKPLQESSS